MQQTVLAQSVVEIVAKGVDKVRADFVKAAGSVAQFTTSAKTAFAGFGKALLATGALMSGFFAYFARGAMQGTAEGERFGKAIEFTTRVIGDMFAPIVRLATTGLIQLSRNILKIPESTRLLVTWIFAAVAAVTALSGAFMLLAPVFSPLVSAIFLLLNPLKYISLLMVAAMSPIKLLGALFSVLASSSLILGRALYSLIPSLIATGQQMLALAAATATSIVASMRAMAVSVISALNPMNLIRIAMTAYAASVAASNTATGLFTMRLLALESVKTVILGLASSMRLAVVGAASFATSMGTSLVAGISKAGAAIFGLLGPIKLVGASMSLFSSLGLSVLSLLNPFKLATSALGLFGFVASGIGSASVAGITLLRNTVLSIVPAVASATAGLIAYGSVLTTAVTGASTKAAASLLLLLNPVKLLTGALSVFGIIASGAGSAGVAGFGVLRNSIMSVIPAVTAATTGFLSYASALATSVAAGSAKAATSIVGLLNPLKLSTVLLGAFRIAAGAIGSAGLVGFTLLRTAVAGIIPVIASATSGIIAYGAALTSSVAAASAKAVTSLLSLLNPMNLVRAGIMGIQGVFASFTAIVSGTAAIFSGVFGLIGALIGPILVGLVALEARATGAFAPGITMAQRFTSVIQAMLNLWEGVKSMGMILYSALKPTIDWVISSFTSGWKYIMKLLGVDMDASAQQGAGAMATTFSSFSETIVSIFGRIREWWLKLVHFMSTKWSQAIDGIAQGLAWIGEKVGVLPKGIQDVLNQDIAAQRKKDADEQKKQMEELRAATAKAMEELKKALEKNKQKAKELAAPILEMLGLANKGGGFHIKMDVGFETLQGTFERLQKSMVSGGATIEQAQLKEMKGMRDDIQKGNAELVNIKNKVGGAVE
ncbi:hypothetical protein UFOVP731_16 [uncultured Caudovirales phage]|uniref:Uncharacterized protein n=1 Tax=uncultured Caudovirales phage TaxID=2100421 RepID=A0A6J5NT20_9CAUD|nr:hypothetical protein UFOVP731_16 [uncultured Caudovirales phage]